MVSQKAIGSCSPRSVTDRPISFAFIPTGTGLERLTDDPAYEDQAAFSPDGCTDLPSSPLAPGKHANSGLSTRSSHKASRRSPHRTRRGFPPFLVSRRRYGLHSPRVWIATATPPAKGRWGAALHLVDIYLIHPDGTGLKRISQHWEALAAAPKWTPDSKSVIHLIACRRRIHGTIASVTATAITRSSSSTSPAAQSHRWPPARASKAAAKRCCPRARSLIFAVTRPSTESFIRAARPVPRAAICALPPGRPTGRRSSNSRYVSEHVAEP